jgi:hypothetical protein
MSGAVAPASQESVGVAMIGRKVGKPGGTIGAGGHAAGHRRTKAVNEGCGIAK